MNPTTFTTDFKVRDITGLKVNRITVLRLHSVNLRPGTGKRIAFWQCVCDCGTKFVVRAHCLTKSNPQKSCGCWLGDKNKERATHGMVGHPMYQIWSGMKARCADIKNNRYGGRGIKVCPEWMEFDSFYRDMREGFSDGLTIERRNNDGDYCKSNCVWATPKTQARNRRTTRLLTAAGVTMPLCEWAEAFGINRSSINSRLKYGWTPERAVSTPIRKHI